MEKKQEGIEPIHGGEAAARNAAARNAAASAAGVIFEGNICELLAILGDLNAHTRHVARRKLVALGGEALPALKWALKSTDWHTRREAARALGEIASPDGAPALAAMLVDEDTSVRWAAMTSLIRIGVPSVRPLLELLTQQFYSAQVRDGVTHVLKELKNRGKLTGAEKHVLHALQGPSPTIEAPWAAREALEEQPPD